MNACADNGQNFFSVEESDEIWEQGWDGDPDLGPNCPVFDEEGNLAGCASLL